MKELSDTTFLCIDSGLYLPLAQCLSRQAKRVIWWNPDRRPARSVKQACVAKGFENIEVATHDFTPRLNEIDCVCVPDVGLNWFQQMFLKLNKPVWGSRSGDIYELDREFFMRTLKDLGLDVPTYKVVKGWTALKDYLSDKEEKFIKISYFRADLETKRWRSKDMDEPWLYWVANSFGPLKEEITFLVFDQIDTDIEDGFDTINVRGKWPNTVLHGIEGKDKVYLSAVKAREDLPEYSLRIMEAFSPLLAKRKYANQLSAEIRVKDGKAFFLDFTGRASMPGSCTQYLIWQNFPQMVLAGAHGELVEPEAVASYSIECMVTSKAGEDGWDSMAIDGELFPWLNFSECCRRSDGVFAFPPNEFHSGDLGWLVALGETPTEALKEAKRLADLLPDGLNADVEALSDVIKETETMAKEGIEFSDDKMPNPAMVLE
jgi:hypothetical protein